MHAAGATHNARRHLGSFSATLGGARARGLPTRRRAEWLQRDPQAEERLDEPDGQESERRA